MAEKLSILSPNTFQQYVISLVFFRVIYSKISAIMNCMWDRIPGLNDFFLFFFKKLDVELCIKGKIYQIHIPYLKLSISSHYNILMQNETIGRLELICSILSFKQKDKQDISCTLRS